MTHPDPSRPRFLESTADQPWEPVPLDAEISSLVGVHLLAMGDADALVMSIDPPRRTGYGELSGQFVVSHWRRGGPLPRLRVSEAPGFMTVAALALARDLNVHRAFRVDAVIRSWYGPPRLTHAGVAVSVEEALSQLPAAPDPRAAAQARVARIRATYGRMLTDIAYRIDNSALFDSAVPTTSAFESALALWSDTTTGTPDEEVIRRSAIVTVTFDTARAHAETVGLAHLPLAARGQGRRAAGAARLARSATTEAERSAAEAQVVRILGSLALYYLPRPEDFRRAITEC